MTFIMKRMPRPHYFMNLNYCFKITETFNKAAYKWPFARTRAIAQSDISNRNYAWRRGVKLSAEANALEHCAYLQIW